MVMVTTAPLVCNKIMFTQALNVSGDPASRLSPARPRGRAGDCAENTGLHVLVRVLSEPLQLSMCPLARGRCLGAEAHACPAPAQSRDGRTPPWLWAFARVGGEVCSAAA